MIGLLGAAMLVAAPALADVKAGVDAWQRGDYRKAVEEWRGPAVAGDPDAQFNLGQAYKLGRGVPVDLAMAESWYGKAALQGHPQGEDNYGLALFENNRRDQALPWLEKSAARGEPRAQYVLGTMLFNGDAVKRDWVRAYALMTRSSAAGIRQATETLAQMDRYISLEQRQQGTELARSLERGATPGRPAPDAFAIAAAPPPRPRAEPKPPAAAPRPAPARVAPRPADGGWRVQLGAFGDPGNARKLWSQVGGRFPGRQAYFVKTGSLTKLLVGPFGSQGDAARACGSVSPCVPVRG